MKLTNNRYGIVRDLKFQLPVDSKIVLPDNANEQFDSPSQIGIVKYLPLDNVHNLKVGDRVILPAFPGCEATRDKDGDTIVLATEDKVLATIESK